MSEKNAKKVVKKELSDIIVVTYNEGDVDQTKTIKMSMGLIQAIFSKFVDKDQIFNLGLDAYLQNVLINEVMDDRDENGNRKNPNKNWAMFLSCEEGEKLNTWISEHIVDFFISKLARQQENLEKLTPVLEEINKAGETLMTEIKESKPA